MAKNDFQECHKIFYPFLSYSSFQDVCLLFQNRDLLQDSYLLCYKIGTMAKNHF